MLRLVPGGESGRMLSLSFWLDFFPSEHLGRGFGLVRGGGCVMRWRTRLWLIIVDNWMVDLMFLLTMAGLLYLLWLAYQASEVTNVAC